MEWLGKAIGGTIGFFALGPFGAALGLVVGHTYDQSAAARTSGAPASFGALFFMATFTVMGHLAKADGRVSEREISAARAVMAALQLDEASVRAAIGYFQQGKQSEFDLAATLATLRRACVNRPDLLRIFFEIQMRAALDGTDLAPPTRGHIERVGEWLGISAGEFAHIEGALRARRTYGAGGASTAAATISLAEAYAVLEIAADAKDADVAKAYRRQLSRHHPDKLKANGLPESMLEHAKQRTQQIIEAWERVRAARGMRQ